MRGGVGGGGGAGLLQGILNIEPLISGRQENNSYEYFAKIKEHAGILRHWTKIK